MSLTRGRAATVAASVAWHLALLAVLLRVQPEPAVMIEPQPISVVLAAPPLPEVIPPPPVEPEPPPPEPRPPKPTPPRATKAPPPRVMVRETHAPLDMPALAAGPAGASAVASTGPPGPSDADLAGASVAGSGAGSACDMTRRLQAALRRDPQVLAAVADAHHAGAARPLWIWNGSWVRSQGQEGAGLAALREAIQWEVGFAPAACRKDPVRGLVLITLADGPSGPRLVLGGGTWRWSDLLGLRRGG